MDYGLKITPYPYQQEGIAYGLEHKRLLIGDECGLGKSLEAIGIVNTAPAFPCLVICPSALKINWQREWEKFTDKKALVLDDSTRTTWPYLLQMRMYDVAIVNYESLRKYFVWDIKKNKEGFRMRDVVFCPHIKEFKAVIVDEAHRCKDSSAAQSIFTKGITTGKEWIILLTGTPVVNNPNELMPQLSIMNRLEEFGGKTVFQALYGNRDTLPELSAKLYKTCLIRREKAAVLTQLPNKTRVDVVVDISNREECNKVWEDLAGYLREYKGATNWEVQRKMRMEALVRFMNLRTLTAHGKIQSAIDFIRLIVETGDKIIVFCSYHTIVDELKLAFPQAVSVTGRDSAMEKQAAVDAFQNSPECQIIICSIKAAGVGLTLTASSKVLFVELPYTYADCVQAEDRCIIEGEKILTPEGWTAIEEIKTGDKVINRFGDAVLVADAWRKQNTKLVTDILVEGYGTIKTTNDHLHLTTRGWVEAWNLRPGDKLVMPKPAIDVEDIEYIPFDADCRLASVFTNNWGKPNRNGRLIKAPDVVHLDEETLFVFGYFIGDGFARVRKGVSRFISVSGHYINKRESLVRCKRWFDRMGLHYHEYRGSDQGVEIRAFSGEWALFFHKHFGVGAYNKQIPEFLMCLNSKQSSWLLKGLLCSDGYYRRKRYEYATMSSKLASQVFRIMLRAGYRATINKTKYGCYVVSYAESQRDNYSLVRAVCTHYPQKKNGTRPYVYDITTDNTESFVLGSTVVHNCYRIGQKDNVTCYYLLGQNTIDNKLYKLIQDKRSVANTIMASEEEVPTDLRYFEEIVNELI